MSKTALPPWVQIALHLAFALYWNAYGQGLIPEDHVGKWLNVIFGTTQSVLAIYGVFTPSPGGPKQPQIQKPSGKPR